MLGLQVDASVLFTSLIGFFLIIAPGLAQCVSSDTSPESPSFSNGPIGLVLDGVPANRIDGINQGKDKWNASSCNTNGTAFPQFQIGSSGAGRILNVVWNEGLNLENPHSCGGFVGNRIDLYSKVRNPARGDQVEGCGGNNVLGQTFAHELGHALGLRDQFSTSCRGFMMYQREYTSEGLLRGRSIQDSECSMADQINMTSVEIEEEAPEPPGTEPIPVPPDPDCETGCSPILIDLRGDGFDLTRLGSGVGFDIDADGREDQISWTDRFGNEAFLALDRNGNGTVDDGSELFGDSTDQPPSDDPNGFRALAVFDAPENGGNDDGWLSAEDAIFPQLLLWRDASHDGRASPLELTSLAESGVEAIELRYVSSRRRDQHGNLFRWASRIHFERGLRLGAIDVVFLKE